MPTLTIEIPDDLAERLAALPEAALDRNAVAVAALAAAADIAEQEEEEGGEPDPDLIAALRAGSAEMDAGKLLTLEEIDAAVASALSDLRQKASFTGA